MPDAAVPPHASAWSALPGRATSLGSWPGTDPLEAARVAFGELPEPHIPYLPELPARGPGADMIGRGAGLLVDLPVDLQPSGWRLVDRPGRDHERATSWLRQDLDVLAEVADGYRGPLKVQAPGPWTLASSLWLPRLERAVVDPGACRDLAASLAEGVSRHVADVRRLVPGAQVVVQLDEPSLPGVLAGALPTASGFGRLRAVDRGIAEQALRDVLDAARAAGAVTTVGHCCAPDVPLGLLARTGTQAVSVDVGLLGVPGWEAVAELHERGIGLWAGVVATSGTPRPAPPYAPPAPAAVADLVWSRWRALGLPATGLDSVVLTPACGLAGATPVWARAVLTRLREAAAVLAERAQS
ncbi:MAG: methionine synthase [Kineosporiaceae bacterium]